MKDPAEFVQNIPFTETREYLQSVVRNAEIYRKMYGFEVARTMRPVTDP